MPASEVEYLPSNKVHDLVDAPASTAKVQQKNTKVEVDLLEGVYDDKRSWF